jgi:hypothetical protein
MPSNYDNRLEFKDYKMANLEKSKPLEAATDLALRELNLVYENTTSVYNGSQRTKIGIYICGSVPDFILSTKYVIECKNWDNDYRISLCRVNSEIVKRLDRYQDKERIVIFGKRPQFNVNTEKYLWSRMSYVLYLGFDVTWKSVKRASRMIKDWLYSIINSRVSTVYCANCLVECKNSEESFVIGVEYRPVESEESVESHRISPLHIVNGENNMNNHGQTGESTDRIY